jgi:hypothetical protein
VTDYERPSSADQVLEGRPVDGHFLEGQDVGVEVGQSTG